MVTVHQRLGEAVQLLGIVGALWAGWCVYRRTASPSLRVYVLLSEAVITVHRPHDSIHFFYGPAVFLSLPAAWLIGTRTDERGEHLALLGGCVAVVLFSIRAIQTGGG
jgi:hypothetical protein